MVEGYNTEERSTGMKALKTQKRMGQQVLKESKSIPRQIVAKAEKKIARMA